MDKESMKLIIGIILIIPLTLSVPLTMKLIYEKFTWSFEKAQQYQIDKSFEELGHCEFGAVSMDGRPAECQRAPCKKYNIYGKECVREGYTGKGFLGFTDFYNEYYICEGYGRMALSCVEYFQTQDEVRKYLEEGEKVKNG